MSERERNTYLVRSEWDSVKAGVGTRAGKDAMCVSGAFCFS